MVDGALVREAEVVIDPLNAAASNMMFGTAISTAAI